MTDWLLEELAAARRARTSCALVTVAATKGSVPRAAGSKMLVYTDGKASGTIGGGKFESLVIKDAQLQIRAKKPLLKTYPLHEKSRESFGAICGGEMTVLIEPQILNEALFLIGGGHCALAIAKLAVDCGLFVTVVDDRVELLSIFPPQVATVGDRHCQSKSRNRYGRARRCSPNKGRGLHRDDRERPQSAARFRSIEKAARFQREIGKSLRAAWSRYRGRFTG